MITRISKTLVISLRILIIRTKTLKTSEFSLNQGNYKK